MSTPYDLEFEKIRQVLERKKYNKILLQFPEGMLETPLKTVIEFFTPLKKEIIVAGYPSYGACDIAVELANRLDCELLIHYGHTDFAFKQKIYSRVGKSLDVLLIPAFVTFNLSPYIPLLLEKLTKLNWNKVILVATAQHINHLQEVKSHLDSVGIESVIHGEGQILGCHVDNVKIPTNEADGIVSLHAGRFHSHGLLLNTSLSIVQLNPFTGQITYFSDNDRNNLIRKRYSVINRAREADAWGILGSSRIGQFHQNKIKKAEKLLLTHKKTKVVFISDEISPQFYNNVTWLDAWVDTACPRLALDDQTHFQQPILAYKEFLYLFDELSWEDLLTTGFF